MAATPSHIFSFQKSKSMKSNFRFWLAMASMLALFILVHFGECEAPQIAREQVKTGALPFTGIVIGFTIIFFSVVAISVISHYEKEVKEKYNL